MSDEQANVERILAAVNAGQDLTNEDARVLADVINSLDFAFRVQNTVNQVIVETLPDMAESLAASILSRAGRTETKIRRSVVKICDEHVAALLGMVTNIAQNLVNLAQEPAVPESGEPAAQSTSDTGEQV